MSALVALVPLAMNVVIGMSLDDVPPIKKWTNSSGVTVDISSWPTPSSRDAVGKITVHSPYPVSPDMMDTGNYLTVETHAHSRADIVARPIPDTGDAKHEGYQLACSPAKESCGVEATNMIYRAKLYDTIFLTDHDQIDDTGGSIESATKLPNGTEMHVGAFGTVHNARPDPDYYPYPFDAIDGIRTQRLNVDTPSMIVANHPNEDKYPWTIEMLSRLSEDVWKLKRPHPPCELYAYGMELLSGWPVQTRVGTWDSLLAGDHLLWGTMSDDYHPQIWFKGFIDRGAISVFAESSGDTNSPDTKERIVQAMLCGRFIAKSGTNAPDLFFDLKEDRGSVNLTARTRGISGEFVHWKDDIQGTV